MNTWNGWDGLINDKPFMPGETPTRQALALMQLAEQEGERLGENERRMIFRYANAIRDYRKVRDLINELCEVSYELHHGYMDPLMEGYIEREIARAAGEEPVFAAAMAV